MQDQIDEIVYKHNAFAIYLKINQDVYLIKYLLFHHY